jgi:cold shock protein
MGRGRDFRGGGVGRGRHAPEEDQGGFLAPTAPYPQNPVVHKASPDHGTAIDAIVKWFNSEKGCGFVEVADGSGDAFLHIKTLQAMGRDTISAGAKLNVFIGQGDKGRHISRIVAIEDGGQTIVPSPAASYPIRQKRREVDSSTAKEVAGKVKWFSAEKGMGFVAAEDGGKDVFVHISVVKKARMADLSEDQRISMRVTETPKGRQAVSIAAVD